MFLLLQNDENQAENGSKNSKIRFRARPPAEPQKKCCKPKNWGQKVEKHVFFSLFACRFWTGAFTNRCSPYCFLQCFFEGERNDLSKTQGFGKKRGPPPGKPVTFYGCHPEDHAPAPSVQADFICTAPRTAGRKGHHQGSESNFDGRPLDCCGWG